MRSTADVFGPALADGGLLAGATGGGEPAAAAAASSAVEAMATEKAVLVCICGDGLGYEQKKFAKETAPAPAPAPATLMASTASLGMMAGLNEAYKDVGGLPKTPKSSELAERFQQADNLAEVLRKKLKCALCDIRLLKTTMQADGFTVVDIKSCKGIPVFVVVLGHGIQLSGELDRVKDLRPSTETATATACGIAKQLVAIKALESASKRYFIPAQCYGGLDFHDAIVNCLPSTWQIHKGSPTETEAQGPPHGLPTWHQKLGESALDEMDEKDKWGVGKNMPLTELTVDVSAPSKRLIEALASASASAVQERLTDKEAAKARKEAWSIFEAELHTIKLGGDPQVPVTTLDPVLVQRAVDLAKARHKLNRGHISTITFCGSVVVKSTTR